MFAILEKVREMYDIRQLSSTKDLHRQRVTEGAGVMSRPYPNPPSPSRAFGRIPKSGDDVLPSPFQALRQEDVAIPILDGQQNREGACTANASVERTMGRWEQSVRLHFEFELPQ